MSDTVIVNGVEVDQEEVARAMALLTRTKEQRAKQRDKQKNDPEAKAKSDERAKRLRVKNTILCQKAVTAGIVVTPEEIDAYIANQEV